MNHKRKFFDSRARQWDKKQHLGDPDRIKSIVSAFKIRKGAKILDIGCGTGVLLPHLLRSVGTGGRVFGLDFSLAMLKKAKQKTSSRKAVSVNADARSLPFREGSFDRITCFATFPHLDEKKRCLKEMTRTLKIKGKLFIFHLSDRRGVNAFHQNSAKVIAHDLLPQEKIMKKMMKQAGLKNIKIVDKPWLYLANGEKGWGL